MPLRRRGAGDGTGTGLLTATRVLSAAELQGIRTNTYQIAPAAPADRSYVVHDVLVVRTAGTALGALRYNPDLAVVLGPESTTAGLNANTGSENFAANVYTGDIDNHITADAYRYFSQVSHSLADAQAILVGMYGTVSGSAERAKFAAIGGTLSIRVRYELG